MNGNNEKENGPTRVPTRPASVMGKPLSQSMGNGKADAPRMPARPNTSMGFSSRPGGRKPAPQTSEFGFTAFGKQPTSGKPSGCSFGFGTSQRSAPIKSRKLTPGPGNYKHDSDFGHNHPNAPSFTFGGGGAGTVPLRPATPSSIGPGRYKLPSSVGKQMCSNRKSGNAFRFGTERRDKPPRSTGPSPNQLVLPSGVGQQFCSKKRNPQSMRFGTSKRHVPFRTASPGPVYDTPSGVGQQKKSTNKSAPAFKFGSSQRSNNEAPNQYPGPGNYQDMSSCGKQVNSRCKSGPSFSFGGPL